MAVLDNPAISVVLPVRNGAKWIGEALHSVARQTLQPIEIIVVDGQSSDESAATAREFPLVQIIEQAELGVGAGLNLGFDAAKGDFLTMIACDDVWRPEKLETQIAQFRRDPSLDVVFGRVSYSVMPGEQLPAGLRPDILEHDQPGHLLELMMVRRDMARRVGAFRNELKIACDVDWFARLADAGAKAMSPDAVLLEKRLHGGGNATDAALNTKELLSALRSSVARKQSAPSD